MLYGPPLKALVDEVARLEGERDKATLRAVHVDQAAEHEHNAHAQVRADLATERAAVVRLSNEAEPLRAHLAAALIVVEAVKHDRKVSVLSGRLEAAMEKYDLEVKR